MLVFITYYALFYYLEENMKLQHRPSYDDTKRHLTCQYWRPGCSHLEEHLFSDYSQVIDFSFRFVLFFRFIGLLLYFPKFYKLFSKKTDLIIGQWQVLSPEHSCPSAHIPSVSFACVFVEPGIEHRVSLVLGNVLPRSSFLCTLGPRGRL